MKPAELAVAKRRPTRTGKRGGQKGNSNALKTGVWAAFSKRNLDGRTAMAKSLAATRQLLVDALGGKPTPQQSIIVERAVYKAFRCGLFETAHLNGTGDDHSAASDTYYLAWSNSLRLDLAALGLDGIASTDPEEQRPLIRVTMVPASNSEGSQDPEEESGNAERGEAHALIRVQMVPALSQDDQAPPKSQPQPLRQQPPEWSDPEPPHISGGRHERLPERRTGDDGFIPVATWGVS